MSLSKKHLRVLHIDDSSEDSALIEKCLQGLHLTVEVISISGRKELEEALSRQTWDLVLSDYISGNLHAREAFSLVRRIDPDLPFIIVSQSMGEEIVVDLMKAGIEDVVLKNRLERLTSVVRRALREHEIRNQEARALRRADEAIAAREQMLAIVSHDIKNPLSAIQLEAQGLIKASALKEKDPFAAEVRAQGERILKITHRLKTLISDLLDRNKEEDGLTKLHLSEGDPVHLLLEVLDNCRPLITQKEVRVKTHIPDAPLLVSMDRNKMFQVFCNLLTNAIRFAPRGGEITFGIKEGDEKLQFWVQDNGPGLIPEMAEKIFEKYWSGRKEADPGAGLGLFICKSIVEAHGGHIEASNGKEGGAIFHFSIPRKSAQKSDIFVIDDDDDLREVISWALSKEGYQVKNFKRPEEALRQLQQSPPGLILVDQNMEGMKGGDFLRRKNNLGEEVRECPSMIISGAPDEVAEDVPQELYDEVLPKPLDLDKLLSKVKEHFRGVPPEVNWH